MFVAPSAVGYEVCFLIQLIDHIQNKINVNIKSYNIFTGHFQVYVNGMKHSTFKHRLPVEKVSNLGISGDVAMNVLGYIDVRYNASCSL